MTTQKDKGWTPGPWECVPSTEDHGPYVSGPYGDVADCYTMTNPRFPSVVNGGDSQPHHFCGEEADANARLISAAPELYEALEKAEISLSVLATEQVASNARKRVLGWPESFNHIEAHENARTALSKAVEG